jgi:hypothetical protein
MKKIIILMTAFLFTLGLSAGQKSPASQLVEAHEETSEARHHDWTSG